MFKTDLIFNGQKRSVSFFEDDTINIVRQQVSRVLDIHQDRLFILVGLQLSRNFYKQDPRNWETLYNRISLNGKPIQREMFQAYCTDYRVPSAVLPYGKLDREEWMAYPDFLRDLYDPGGEFMEYRIMGVDPEKSYTLPFEVDPTYASQIPSAQYPIPENEKLFLSLYPTKFIKNILAIEYLPGAEGGYFPLFRATTPSRLTEDQIRLLESNTKHLKDLLDLTPPPEKDIHILKASWRIQFVETDFGDAARTRFEQMFYGLSVSKTVPCVTFFTGRSEISRHKFYKESAQTQTTYLELPVWASWWAKSKPSIDRVPTLILYRGKDRDIFDRVTLRPTEIIFAVYRDTSNKKALEDLKTGLVDWFKTFDSIIPFVDSSDILPCRLEIQDIRFEASYDNTLEDFDTRRMNCLAGIFEEHRKEKTIFKFLRADNANDGITPVDLKVINILRDDPFVTPDLLADELKITLPDSQKILQNIKQRIEEQPALLNRQFRNFPALLMKPKSIEITSVDNIPRFLKYANLLRYILSNPNSKEVDKVCPKRLETVDAIVSTATTHFIDTEFTDLFSYLEGDVEEPEIIKPATTGKKSTLYNYFNRRLQEFDPETFDPTGSEYPKKCEQSHQPIILSDKEISDIVDDATKGPDYDPRLYEGKKKMEVEEPHGVVVCPDYWCMYDKIPLQESQLKVEDGVKMCPVCDGKVRSPSDTKSDIKEFSVISRTKGFSYPGLMDYLSPKNKRNLPCCYKTAKERKLIKDDKDDKFYILGESKVGLNQTRLAYLPLDLLNNLRIPESYSLANKSGNRIQTGMSGYFRIGLGKPSTGLPMMMNLNATVQSPRHSVKCLLRCSFIATWPQTSEDRTSTIENSLESIEPFKSCMITRAHMAKTISSIDSAFLAGELTPLQELEYSAIVLGIDVFRFHLEDQTMSCTFYTPQTQHNTRGIIILQRGKDLDCLCYVTRLQKKFQYRSNVYETPFTKKTTDELVSKHRQACNTSIPSFENAIYFMADLGLTEFSFVLDPFGRGQAIYIPNEILLPFQNTPMPPLIQPKIQGYKDVRDLPTYSDTRSILERASKIAPGYEWVEDMHDSAGQIVEILTKSGLRIPVVPQPSEGEASEVTQTIRDVGETMLALGQPNEEDLQHYKAISYAAELYEFLIFQLTRDIHNDYGDLKAILSEATPSRKDLEPELEKWFTETTYFVNSGKPIEFLSKIRKPCGQFKKKDVCESGHMCAWNGKQCRIQVRDSVNKPKLFNKLLATLVDNSKIRAMVLDGRTTPFFSTVLYIDLPTEIIFTDLQLKVQ